MLSYLKQAGLAFVVGMTLVSTAQAEDSVVNANSTLNDAF